MCSGSTWWELKVNESGPYSELVHSRLCSSLLFSYFLPVPVDILGHLFGVTHFCFSSSMSCPGGQPHPGMQRWLQRMSGSLQVAGQVRHSWKTCPLMGQSVKQNNNRHIVHLWMHSPLNRNCMYVSQSQFSLVTYNAWRWDLHRYVGKDLWIPMILVLFAYCIAGGVHAEKVRKSTVRSLMKQPTQFLATLLSAQGSYGDEYQARSSRVL